jgi:hypothetical protein
MPYPCSMYAASGIKKEKGPKNEPLTLDIVFFIKWVGNDLNLKRL